MAYDPVAFTRAYAECGLWCDLYDEQGERVDAQPGDYDLEDLTPEARQQVTEDCRSFCEDNREDLLDLDPEQCGHDFWLTRNGHGAGFWDRGLGELGDRLSKACKPYGSAMFLLREDGKIDLE